MARTLSPLMAELEARHKLPIERIVRDAIIAAGSIDAAADKLDVNRKTFHGWLPRLRIEVRRELVLA
jgi:transcriptional regulator of acetoin/glycerol metabolism